MASEGNISLKSEATTTQWIAKAMALNDRFNVSVRSVSDGVKLVTEEAEGEIVNIFANTAHGVIEWINEVYDGVNTIVDGVKKTYNAIKRGIEGVKNFFGGLFG